MARLLTCLAFVALAIVGASAASGTYSAIDTASPITTRTAKVTVGDKKASYLGGVDEVKIEWTGFNVDPADTMAIKMCYSKDKIKDRPWRKFVDGIDKNKQCIQSADTKKFLLESFAAQSSGSQTIKLPMNTAPSDYTFQVLQIRNDKYTMYADSKEQADKGGVITTTIYDTQPASLKATQAFFCVFSILVLIVAYGYDRAKQA